MKRPPNLLGMLFGRADQAGMTVALAFAPATFQRTLIKRNSQDQGITTGMSLAIAYLLAGFVQDSVEAVASRVLGRRFVDEADDDVQRRIAMAFDAAAIMTGLTTQLAFKQERNEPLYRAAVRTSGYWLAVGATGGISAAAAQEWLQSIDRGSRRDLGLRRLPAPLVAGAIYAALAELRRRQREAQWLDDRKGLYAKARAGIIKEFTGISDPYDLPADAEVVIDTLKLSAEEAAQEIYLRLEKEGYIGAEE